MSLFTAIRDWLRIGVDSVKCSKCGRVVRQVNSIPVADKFSCRPCEEKRT